MERHPISQMSAGPDDAPTGVQEIRRRYTHDPRVDTGKDFYLDQDPLALVSPAIMEFLQQRCGKEVLDLGCGVGGYARRMQDLGYTVVGVDRNPIYVERARSLGVRVEQAIGESLPFRDGEFESVYLVEVLEHIPSEAVPTVLKEARRVARRNVLFTVPDCTQYEQLLEVDLLHGHFRAVDHVQFFTVDSMRDLLLEFFPRATVTEGDALHPHRLLPRWVRRPLSLAYRLGILRSTLYSRLYAEAFVHG